MQRLRCHAMCVQVGATAQQQEVCSATWGDCRLLFVFALCCLQCSGHVYGWRSCPGQACNLVLMQTLMIFVSCSTCPAVIGTRTGHYTNLRQAQVYSNQAADEQPTLNKRTAADITQPGRLSKHLCCHVCIIRCMSAQRWCPSTCLPVL
jgi:hypothetical protein